MRGYPKDQKPINNKYYIVATELRNYPLLNMHFNTRQEANDFIDRKFPGLKYYFEVLNGKQCKKWGFKFRKRWLMQHRRKEYFYMRKYDYPKDPLEMGTGEKKLFRQKKRRAFKKKKIKYKYKYPQEGMTQKEKRLFRQNQRRKCLKMKLLE